MPFSTLLYAYLLGGITFLPLLLAAVLIPAWYLLPEIRDDARQTRDSGAKAKSSDDEKKANIDEYQELDLGEDGSASATFAVLRTYNFQAATAALESRSRGSHVGRDHNNDGSSETSESVYQSMYRSVFDRNKNNSNPMLDRDENETDIQQQIKRKNISVSVFYIVLRHGHLMLYDSASQLEVRHVISLASHDVSLSEEETSESMIDGDLFIKRTAIVLTPKQSLSKLIQPATKPFYLFSATCSEKEDFYHALLAARHPSPIPQAIAPADAIKLQSALHSSILSAETRAINALIGRIFLALHRTANLETTVRAKIERKMSRIAKPSFITSLDLTAIDLGDAAPIFSNFRLKDMNITGDTTLSMDVKYNGGMKIAIAAQGKIDLGSRIKARTVDLVLATSLQRLQGHMLVRIKPPPSNRLWFCFESPPEMDIKVEPIVSQRQITYTFILRAIEERLRAVVAETLVKPNWDDIPFFDTRGQNLRGGIWKDEKIETVPTSEDTTSVASEVESISKVKRASTTSFTSKDDSSAVLSEQASRVASSASSLAWQNADNLKRRSVMSLPVQPEVSSSATTEAVSIPRGLRSPSLTMPTPSPPAISSEGATMTSLRSIDATTPSRTWRLRTGQQIPTKREAVDAVREMRDRAFLHLGGDHAADALGDVERHDDEILATVYDEPRPQHGRTPSTVSSISLDGENTGDTRPPNRVDTTSSATATLTRAQQQRKNLFAATAAATNAARNWSWNTIANRGRAGSVSAEQVANATAKGQPIGRGQPLPPPGVPLPGPQKPSWTTAALGTVKRKPAPTLPPRPGAKADVTLQTGSSKESVGDHAPNEPDNDIKDSEGKIMDDEFGPWNHNSGRSTPNPRSANISPERTKTRPKNASILTSQLQDSSTNLGNTGVVSIEHKDLPADAQILASDHLNQSPKSLTVAEAEFARGESTNEEMIEREISSSISRDEGLVHESEVVEGDSRSRTESVDNGEISRTQAKDDADTGVTMITDLSVLAQDEPAPFQIEDVTLESEDTVSRPRT